MARSLRKGPFVDEHLIKKVLRLKKLTIENQLKLGLVDQLSCQK